MWMEKHLSIITDHGRKTFLFVKVEFDLQQSGPPCSLIVELKIQEFCANK